MNHTLKIELKDFPAAHRITRNYEGPCNHLHGHNYLAKIYISASKLNTADMVLDFSIVKSICNKWIKDNLDHSVIISDFDKPLLDFVKQEKQKYYNIGPFNSSVEKLSEHMFYEFKKILPANITLKSIEVFEKSTSSSLFQA
jgi:6-pyruvoyltetrahydropterin/6-carboxytetrahydropterin synthase